MECLDHHVGQVRPPRDDKDLRRLMKNYFVYIMSNEQNTVLYTGVTNDLKKRVYQHKEKMVDGFTKKYNLTKLLYCEVFDDGYNAIAREKQIKAGSRQKKIALISRFNPRREDLYTRL